MVLATPSSELAPLSLEILQRTGILLLEDQEPDTLLQSLFEFLHERTAVDVYFHYLTTADGKHLELASAGGDARVRTMLGMTLEFGQAVCGRVAQSGQPIHLGQIAARTDAMTEIVRSAGAQSYACFPLISHKEVLGTLSFGSTRLEAFSEEDLKLFELIAQQVTLATNRRNQSLYLRNLEQMAAAGRMSAMLAHEINNPLDSINSVLHMLREEVPNAAGKELVEIAKSQLQQLSEVVRRTLETFRGNPTAASAIDISQMAEEIASQIRLPRDVQLATEIEPRLKVRAVQGELRQVLYNLLLNAAQFSPTGREVRLSVKPSGGWLEIRVRDEGVGISEASREKIFQPFFTTRAKGGTGIGLWLSHELVERNGGTLTYESIPELRPGTEFVLRLPLAD